MSPSLRLAALLVLGVVAVAALVWRRGMLRGTTLLAPWWWAVGAIGLLVAVEAMVAGMGADAARRWAAHLRFAAAAGTFCPAMALLGAKRPQDKAWQFVVLGLWATLLLPSGIELVIRPGEALSLHPAYRWFLLILVLVGWTNGLLTRFWLSATLLAAGQMLLLDGHLPWPALGINPEPALTALALAGVALWMWALGVAQGSEAARPLDRLWLDFRDWFGLMWALRVAERFNASSAMYGWGVELHLDGFVVGDRDDPAAEPPAEIVPAIHQNLRNLLRRFVSPEWIASRLGEPDSSD